jgi:uncharacterized protein
MKSISSRSGRISHGSPKVENFINVAIWMSRPGKTYFLFQLKNYYSGNIPLERILYLNFEDDRILPLDHKAMGKLIDSWYTLYPQYHIHQCKKKEP